MPRFLVALTRGALELFRLGEPRPVTLRDGAAGTVRDLTTLPIPPTPDEPPPTPTR